MSGFVRGLQFPSPRLERIKQTVTEIMCLEDVTARVNAIRDPFGVDDPCPVSPNGHRAISSCGEVVCWHCAKIFWS